MQERERKHTRNVEGSLFYLKQNIINLGTMKLAITLHNVCFCIDWKSCGLPSEGGADSIDNRFKQKN